MKNILSALLLFAFGCAPAPQPQPEKTITILWAQWKPADSLQKLSEEFTRETGIKVVIHKTPWDDFYYEFFQSAMSKDQKYDMVAGDSQWLGRGAVDGIYVDLTKWITANHVHERMTEASISGYSEYPKESGKYWAVPLMGDAMGFAYRKDLFENPVEKENFQKKYGYPLAVPKTWAELRDIAEFFNRPEQGFYGVSVWGSRNYDAISMAMQTLIWSYGGDLGDQTTFRVKGILNTKESAEGLRMYKSIHAFSPPQWKNAYHDSKEAFIQGKVAMVMSYFAFFPDLYNSTLNPHAAVTGFFANPAGPKAHVSSLGGQGLSMLSPSKKKEYCLKFLEWFIRPEIQKKWSQLGGYSCDKKVLHSKEFLEATPYNASLTESMNIVRDYWVVPEYLDLLEISQKYWHKFLFSEDFSAEEANNAIATEWENVFEMAGYYKE